MHPASRFPTDPNAPGGPRRSDYVRGARSRPLRDRLPADALVTTERAPGSRDHEPLDRFPRFAFSVPG
jgi:hypothetical protein